MDSESLQKTESAPPRSAPVELPYPQVLDSSPDLLVISYPQVPDDSKQLLADHQFVSPQATILQAPQMRDRC